MKKQKNKNKNKNKTPKSNDKGRSKISSFNEVSKRKKKCRLINKGRSPIFPHSYLYEESIFFLFFPPWFTTLKSLFLTIKKKKMSELSWWLRW